LLNPIIVVLIALSILIAGSTGRMQGITDAALKDSIAAAELALKLVGVMAFFLGLMKVAEDAGLLRRVARIVAPVMRRLFPGVPADHPAMSSMILNIGSTMLGLGNAATPFGIRAMEQLDELNGRKGAATDAMVLFLAISPSGLALLSTGVVGLRAAVGSENPMAIWIPTWFASLCATVVGIVAATALSRLPRYRSSEPPALSAEEVAANDGGGGDENAPVEPAEPPKSIPWRRWSTWVFWIAFVGLFVRELVRSAELMQLNDLLKTIVSNWILAAIVAFMVLYGWSHGVRVYDSLVEGAKEGFRVAVRIIPYLVAILVAVGMFRASGGMDLIVAALNPVTSMVGVPTEALPMAIMRPLSGSGAMGVMVEAMETYGPDSLIGYMVSTFQGSTETTFYVLAVYFGAVGVRRTRHALPACLIADVAGLSAAVFIVQLLLG
jgi:spore maturation protein SpmA